MGVKLLWTGLTVISATALLSIPAAAIVGAVLMIIGCILMWLDR
jgi:hypothetical protein